MRKSNSELKALKDILEIMKKCVVCRLAVTNEKYPYILPLNFGMTESEGKGSLYFHGALDGTKYGLLEKHPHVSFEMDCEHELQTEADRGYCTMNYESVIGHGVVTEVFGDKKKEALDILVGQYHKDFTYNPQAMERTRVLRLDVEEMTVKRTTRKKSS